MTRSFSKFAALAAGLLLVAGCAPERDDAAPGAEGVQQLAILASGSGGGTDIVIMNSNGTEVNRIETTLGGWNNGLAYHPDGFFLIGQGEHLYAIDSDGSSEQFTDTPMWGGIFGISVSDDGEVTVGNAEDGVTKFDDEGEEIFHSTMPGTCFMDVSPVPGESGLDASIDIYGPRIVVADSDDGTLDTVASNIGSDAGHLAVDGNGRFYAGSYYGDSHLWLVEGSESTSLGRISDQDVDANWIVAMATASRNSVYALVEGSAGSSIVEVSSDGRVTHTVDAEAEVWSDLVVFQ